jgi:hypothetical protein
LAIVEDIFPSSSSVTETFDPACDAAYSMVLEYNGQPFIYIFLVVNIDQCKEVICNDLKAHIPLALSCLADTNQSKCKLASYSILNSLDNGKISYLFAADPNVLTELYRNEMMNHLNLLLNIFVNTDLSVQSRARSILHKLWAASNSKCILCI